MCVCVVALVLGGLRQPPGLARCVDRAGTGPRWAVVWVYHQQQSGAVSRGHPLCLPGPGLPRAAEQQSASASPARNEDPQYACHSTCHSTRVTARQLGVLCAAAMDRLQLLCYECGAWRLGSAQCAVSFQCTLYALVLATSARISTTLMPLFPLAVVPLSRRKALEQRSAESVDPISVATLG